MSRRRPLDRAGPLRTFDVIKLTGAEVAAVIRRREREHGLALLALNFTGDEQLRAFGERVLPLVA